MRTNAGFTLIEVLVALIILSASLSIVYGVVRQGADQSASIAQRHTTLSEMSSLFKRVGHDLQLQESVLEGRFPSGATWRMEIAPYLEARLRERQDHIRLFKVTIVASWSTPFGSRTEQAAALKLSWPKSQ